jgi:hypothetical protein
MNITVFHLHIFSLWEVFGAAICTLLGLYGNRIFFWKSPEI